MGEKVNVFTNDVLGKLDATGIAELIKQKQISAQEALQASLERVKIANEKLNAVVLYTDELSAKQIDEQRGKDWYGVPTFIKDNTHIKGYPTQMGTKSFKAKPAKRNSKYLDQYLSTGMIVLGKSTLPEFGLICSTENPMWGITRNPWDTDYTPGGSSSGSGALVASGAVAVATANDGAGSTRIPASCCGLVGLKPSRNRLINPDGSEILPVNIGYEGVLTRSVRDTANFYALAEQFYKNPKLESISNVERENEKRLKVVYYDNITPGKMGHQDADTRAVIENTALLLKKLGHQVEKLPFPLQVEDYYNDFLNYYGFVAFAMRDLGRFSHQAKVDKTNLESFTNGLSSQFKRNFLQIPKNLKRLKSIGADFEKIFEQYDIVLTPVTAHTTTKIGYFEPYSPFDDIANKAVSFAPFTGLQNISGAPGISLPMGKSSLGMPIGVQFVAPYGQDRRLLELGFELEKAQPFSMVCD